MKDFVFHGATQLKSVTFETGSSCRTIGLNAFFLCWRLSSIVIPNSVTSISQYAFEGCGGLTSISLPFIGDGTSSNTHFGYIFGAADYEENNGWVPESLKSVTITGTFPTPYSTTGNGPP